MVTCLALFILKIILWGEYVYPFILVHGLAASPRAFRCTHMQRLMLKCPVFLNCSPAYCLRKGLSLNLEFTPSARLVDQQVSKNCLHIPRFYMDPGDPNSILTVHEKPLTLWDSSLQLPPLQESQGVSLGSSRMKMMEQNWQEWGRDFRDDARRQDPSSLKTVSTLSAWSWFGKDWIATCHRHLQEDSSCLGDETAVLQAHISTWRYAQRLRDWLLLQRSHIWFPAPTRWLTDPDPRDLISSSGLHRRQVCIWHIYIHACKYSYAKIFNH